MGTGRPIDTAEVGLILLRRKLELTPGGGCGPVIDRSTKLNLSVHNPIINDVDKTTPAALLLKALADRRHPFPVRKLVIPQAAHTFAPVNHVEQSWH